MAPFRGLWLSFLVLRTPHLQSFMPALPRTFFECLLPARPSEKWPLMPQSYLHMSWVILWGFPTSEATDRLNASVREQNEMSIPNPPKLGSPQEDKHPQPHLSMWEVRSGRQAGPAAGPS